MEALELLQDKKKFDEMAQGVFQNIDSNNNGKIEFSEMKRAVQSMYDNVQNKLNDEEIDQAIQQLDKDQNSLLSRDELSALLRQILKQSVPEYTSDNEKKSERINQFQLATSFRKKKILLTKEEKKQELKSLKKEIKELKEVNLQRKQLQNQRIVNVYLKYNTTQHSPSVKDEELRQKQEMFDTSSVRSSNSSKSSISLNPLVINQNIRQGFFKNAEDVVKAASVVKNSHLIGMAVKRISAGEWQGLVDYFNEQTDNEFDRTPSSQSFHTISKKLSKNVKFILIHIQNLVYTNVKDLRVSSKQDLVRTDQPALFFWEVLFNGKSYFQNSAKELANQLNECLDSILVYNYINPIEVILWKKQGKEAVYVAQFDVTPQIFQAMRLVKDTASESVGGEEETKFKLNLKKINKSLRRLESQKIELYRKKRISYVKKEEDTLMFGKITVQFQMFEIFEYDAPISNYYNYIDLISNVCGSPRTLEERTRRKLVEDSKYGPYKWPDDQQNKALVIYISEAGTQLIIANEEDVKAFIDGDMMTLIKENLHIEGVQGSSRANTRQRKRQLTEQQMNLIKELGDLPLVVEINNLRKTIRQGRLPKKDLEAALQSIGLDPLCKVFIDVVDDLGDCPLDDMFGGSYYGAVIDTIQDMQFDKQENIVEADIFAEKFVNNIKSQLLLGDRLEPLFEFLKAAEKIPHFGITINLIADQFNNGLGASKDENDKVAIDNGALISYFDINSRDFEKMENYEHVMILGKLLKLAKKHLKPEDPFLTHLQQNHDEVKQKVYFTVPVLPKKMNLKEKAKLLTLVDDNVHMGSLLDGEDAAPPATVADVKREMKKKKEEMAQKQDDTELKPCLWNICHELARRKRWKMFFDGYAAAPEFYYQKDASGNAPLLDLFETGPFSVINQMISKYHPSNPNEDDIDIPKLDVQKMLAMNTKQGKSFLHAFALNQNSNPKGQIAAMNAFSPLIDPETWNKMLVTPMKPHDGTPLTLFVNRLANGSTNEDQPVIKEILQLLKGPIKQEYQPTMFRAKQLFATHNIQFDDDNLADYYYNHIQLTKAIAQLQPDMINLVSEEVNWINWFGLNIERYNGKATDIPYAIFNLARQGKLEYLERLLTNFSQAQDELPCKIKPDATFIISKDQNVFITEEDGNVKIFDQKEEKTIEYEKNDMIEALAQFYNKYPLEILIGIKKILDESKFTTANLNTLLDNLFLKIIKQEPRILAKQFYIQSLNSPYEDLVKLGYENILKATLTPEQISAYNPKKVSLAEDIFEQALSGKLKDSEDGLQMDPRIAKQKFFPQTQNMMTEKKLDDVLNFLNKIEKDKIPNRENVQKRIVMQIVQALPNSFAKSQYPKIFKMLKNDKLISSQQLKPLLNAALESNNIPLINNTLQYFWNKQSQAQRMKGVLRPMFQKYGQLYKAMMYHPAVILNQADFKKYMEDTKDTADLKDYEIAAKELTKFGQSERLPVFLKKLVEKRPEVVVNLLEETALKKIEGELTYPPTVPLKPLTQPVQKVQPQYIIPSKRAIIQSQQHLIDAGAIGTLLNHARKLSEKQPHMPKNWDRYNHIQCLSAFQQMYQQKLRSAFLVQRPQTIFNNWSLPPSDSVKTLETILNELNAADDIFTKKPELQSQLKNSDILPLVTKNISILDKLDNQDLRRFNSIEKIILSNLKQKLTKEQLEIVDQRTYRNLEYLQKYFQPTLKTIMEQEKKRTLRILRALELTLKRSQVTLQVQFAVEVVLIIINSFQPSDFSGVIDTNSIQIFNAFAVCLMRSKTEDQRALQFMGTQLNNYQFFDFVSSYAYDKGEGEIKQKQEKNRLSTVQENKALMSIDTLPEKCEIEEASTLVVPSQNNIQYIIKLLKAKVKPFFKTYSKELNYINGEPFSINELKQLNLFEYLIVKCHFTLISKHYAKINKPKNQLQENQIIKYLCLASSSGSYKLFDLITKEILNMDFFNLFKNFDASPDQQKYLNLPIFYQVLIMSSEQSALLYFENIVSDQLTLDLFYKWLQFEDDSKWNCFIPIIRKKYSLLFTKIIQFLRRKLINDQKKDQFKEYYKELSRILNFQNFSESEQKGEEEDENSEQLTLLEYSILQGFPDLGMCVEPVIQLLRNPFEGTVYQIIEPGMKQCGQEFDQETKIRDYLNKYSKEPDFYKVKYYQTFLVIKQFYEKQESSGLQEKQQIQMELALFYISIRFNKNSNFVNSELINSVEELRKQNFEEQFKILHFNRFDKVQKFELNIIDYIQTYHPQLQKFWISKDIHAAFKNYLKYDFRDGFKTMNQDDLLNIDLDLFQPEVQLYILYNQPQIYLSKGMDKFAFFSYKQLLPLIRYVSTKQDMYKIVENIQDEDNPKYQLAASLIFYICSCDDKITYVGETDPKANKIFLILEKLKESFSLREIDQLIVQLIQQMKSNQLYDIVRQWGTNDPKAPINKDIYQEKNFIQGLINFINKYKKGQKINFSYKLNDFLKLLQMEFVKNDKLYKDKLYRGLCIIHIVLNLLQECLFLEENIESEDQVQLNIEIIELSKVKGAAVKTSSIAEIKEGEDIIGFKFQLEMPLCYQERNNVITLFFHQNSIKEFDEILKKKRFEQFKVQSIFENLNQESYVNSMKVTSTIKKNLLTFDNADLIIEQSQSKFPFGFGVQYTQQTLELTIDDSMFVDGPSNYQKRRQLPIENELAINWYFDHIKYQFHIKLNLSVVKKEQSRISREQQLKFLIDDYSRNLENYKIIDKMLEEGKNAEEYISLRNYIREAVVTNEEEKQELQDTKELFSQYKKAPFFECLLDWPLLIDGQYTKSDEYNFPQFTFKKIIIAIESIFQNKYLLNYLSIVDTLLLPFVKMFEMEKKNSAATVSIEDVVYQILDWPLLQCVMMKITEKIGRSSVVFEFKEGPKPDIAKSLKLIGIDDCVQLSLTKYYLHRGLIIVRIGIYFNKKLLTIQNRADGQNLRFSQNQQFNDDITPYFNYIINETQMQQILNMEQNA